jgi:ribosomal protein S18 acetylase RimI-like enzyme
VEGAQPEIRMPRPGEEPEIAALLHESAVDMYDRFAGGRERALRLLERALGTPGTNASAEIVWVAALDGRPAGAMAAFPVDQAAGRANAFLGLTLRSIPPWRWPGSLYLYWAGARAAPPPPSSALYIDALATDPSARRRGVARALLAEAERMAREEGLRCVALDTALGNEPARALYKSAGYEEVAYRPAARRLPGFVALVKELG